MFIAHVVWNTHQSSILFNLNIVAFIVYNCSWLIIKTLKTKQYGKSIDLYSISFELVLTTILSLGTSQINKSMILDFSDIMDASSKVLDNNLDTFYHSDERNNASWFVRPDSVYEVKWIPISIRGGNNYMTLISLKNAYWYLLKDVSLSITVIDKFLLAKNYSSEMICFYLDKN